ncbi:ABC transporter substrate-binding protein [Streptomyces candidus]|uniref:Iron complex transport system substrate-binding protein n=1 Tax=Streptomyces candidus TaxID=67283 RepID=A0A7X0HGC3_9ACTN|nr:ABC transporter substrate-binding protein [Streptomyces candidus]MBB6437021.1 iron complex transport system substrate-binding protein [Streptomyces candidus]GHH32652.1 ABC transporter substrate-binding protein [Streptomyces candidus]
MPSQSRLSRPTRRGLLAVGGALGAGAALAACGGEKTSGGKAEKAAEKSGPWSFTDDRGRKVETKAVPKNIVAFTGTAAALYDYGIEVKGVFGPTKTKDGKADVQAGDMDVAKLEIIGNVYGEFNVEKYAKLVPELLIAPMWEKDVLWYVPEQSAKKIDSLAPSVALWASNTNMEKALARHAGLAASLGADLKAQPTVDAKARFEKAAARLRAAAKARPEIKVMIGSASAELFYVSLAKMSADTLYFQELGVKFVEPKVDAQGFFEGLSWEQVGKYEADVIMMDNRSAVLQPKDLTAKPTWAQLPAVKAGQVIPRVTEPIFSYAKCAPVLDDLAKAIETAKKVS